MKVTQADLEPTRPRVAIVTAPSRGIDAARARQLAADRYPVTLMARGKQVPAVAAEVDGWAVRDNLTLPPDTARLIDAMGEPSGWLDVLVSDAGETRSEPIRWRCPTQRGLTRWRCS